MEDDRKYTIISYLLLIVVLTGMLCSCGTSRVTPASRTEYVILRDTVIQREVLTNEVIRTVEVRDSFIQKEKGDTVLMEHWRIERDYSREAKLQHVIDSLLSVKKDSVTVTKTEYVEKQDGWFKSMLLALGTLTFACMVILFAVMAVSSYLRKKKII